ncbi:hypothetical protein GCM10027416_15310 [Okibacterium endophyticum]
MNETRLEVRGITRRFPGGAGIESIDLAVRAGEIHAIVGLNGAGKTTLMRVLLGMLRTERGTIELDGASILTASPSIWARVGHLVEAPFAYPELTSLMNLRLAARLSGVPRHRIEATARAGLAQLGLEAYERVRSTRLSQGNGQRLGIAAALQHDPMLVVLDEPTNALDPAGVILLRELLLRRADAGAGVLVSSHHLDEVARIAHRITVLNAGRVIGSLDPHGVDIERAFFATVHADETVHADDESAA